MSSPPLDRLLPHRPPMRLLDEVEVVGPGALDARAYLSADHPFVVGGAVCGAVALELLAQAAAALLSLEAPAGADGPAPGVLVRVPELVVEPGALRVGDGARVSVRRTGTAGGLVQLEGEVRRGDVVVARARFSVYRPSAS